MIKKEKIDIVIPWVDGSDEKWKQKKNKYMKINDDIDQMKSDNRYRDYGTLKFLLRSIDKNMNWINNIFLLSDNQLPEWLSNKLKVIDHKQFIKGKLPTFNSNVILTSIGNISDLSEHFIIFNDDLIVWDTLKPEDFFKDGVPVDCLVETGTVPKIDNFFHISQNDVAIINDIFDKREKLKSDFNFFFNYKYGLQNFRTLLSLPYKNFLGFLNPHLAMPFCKKDFYDAYNLIPNYFENTWNHRFRELDDINEWVVRYLRNLNGNFKPGLLKGTFLKTCDFNNGVPKIKNKSKILVINDDGYSNQRAFDNINYLLTSKFGEKSKYEK